MKYRRLGRSGLQVSAIGLGSWQTFGQRADREAASRCVRAALDAGVNLFDTADSYGRGAAETFLGEALAGVPRRRLVLATKCFMPMSDDDPNDRGLSRKHLFESVEASLDRLRTGYIDLLLAHRYDDETPLEETVRAFGDLVRQGKILYWGVSRWSAARIADAVRIAAGLGAPAPIASQNAYSLLHREVEGDVLAACRAHGLGLLAYSPLAQGLLTGKYRPGAASAPPGTRAADPSLRASFRDYGPENVARVARLAPVAEALGIPLGELALAWVLRDPAVASALVGASVPEQVDANVRAADRAMDAGALERLEAAWRSAGSRDI